MGILFNNWIKRTKDLQTDVYYINFDDMSGDKDANIRRLIEYMRWNMLAIDDELAEHLFFRLFFVEPQSHLRLIDRGLAVGRVVHLKLQRGIGR